MRHALLVALALLPLACDDKAPPATPASPDAAAAAAGSGAAPAPAVQANYATGRVTMADGSPLRGEIKDVSISITGIGAAAENISYSPAVKPDGTYRQQLAPAQFRFSGAQVAVLYNGNEFRFDLEPVGNLWNKNRDAAEGIQQDFVWKTTGPTPYGQSEGLDTNNATHWYGMNIGLAFDGYRDDISITTPTIPDGTKLTFTLKPTGKAVDGSDPKPLTFERTIANNSYRNYDLNDILPAAYELTGTATLADGTVKPLLLQGKDEYPGYANSLKIDVEKDNIVGGLWKRPVSFVLGE